MHYWGGAAESLSREFINAPFRTCLLESGGLENEAATQDLYRGRNIGRKYYDLDACRLRYFGGTTNHWAGWCRPLNTIDFENHSWAPYSGWPFGLEELLPYYRRAQDVASLASTATTTSTCGTMLGAKYSHSTKAKWSRR